MKKLVLSMCLLIGALSVSGQGVVYVAPTAQGDGSGSSWENAMEGIQAALGKAHEDATGQTDVWVKAGTYVLSEAISLKDSVNLYGGFAGTESSIDERAKNSAEPWDFANPTILDGQNTVPCAKAVKSMLQPIVVDGLVLQNGSALSANGDNGGGIRLNLNVTLQNSIVRNCYSNNAAGAVQIYPAGNMYGCLLENNRQETNANGGGAVNLNTSSTGNNAYIANCVFRGNTSAVRGGAINCQGQSDYYIDACTFYNNSAITADGTLQNGGAIYDNGGNVSHITNCVVYNNTGKTGITLKPKEFLNNTVVKNAGNVYVAAGTSTSLICNNVIWSCFTDANETTPTSLAGTNTTGMKVLNNFTYNPVPEDKGWVLSVDAEVANSNQQFVSNLTNGDTSGEDIEGDYGNKLLIGPHFVSLSTFTGAVPEDLDEESKNIALTALDAVDLHITSESALLNAGANLDTLLTSDRDGNNRPQGSAYDAGAYELPYYDVVIGTYSAEEGSIMDENGNELPSDTTLSCMSSRVLRLYVMTAEGEAPFKITMVKSDNGGLTFDGEEVDITSQFDPEYLSLDIRVECAFKLVVIWADEGGDDDDDDDNPDEGFDNVSANSLSIVSLEGSVRVSGLQQGGVVEVFDMNGRTVYREAAHSRTMDISLQAGMYIIRQGANRGKAVVK